MIGRPRSPRRGLLTDLPAWLVFAWSFCLLFAVHRVFCRPPLLLHHLDEAYVNAFAWRMNTGHMLPYVDAVSHRGPVFYWVAALAQRLGSPTSWMPIRLCAMGCGLATMAFAFAASWRAGRALTGAIASLATALVLLVGLWPVEGLSYTGEQLSSAFMMAALFCLTAALDPRAATKPSAPLVVAAGALAMLNALSKQIGAVAVVTLGVWVVMTAYGRPGLLPRARRVLVAAYALGALLPLGVIVARYAAAGEVRTLVYYTVTYNAEVYLAPYSHQARVDHYVWWIDGNGVLFGILGPIALWAMTRPLVRAPRLRDLPRAYDEEGFVTTVGVSALCLAVACNAALRDFFHYYLQPAPWLGLLLGCVVEAALATRRPSLRDALARLLILLPVVLLLTMSVSHRVARYVDDYHAKRAWVDNRPLPLCEFVRAHSTADQTLFIWGFSPEYYTACERRPASRFVFTTFVAGYVPWFEAATQAEDDARAVPGSRKQLLDDLEETRPPVLLDNPKTLGNRSMRRYPPLALYLAAHYCSAGIVTGAVEGLLRRDDKGRCPPGSK